MIRVSFILLRHPRRDHFIPGACAEAAIGDEAFAGPMVQDRAKALPHHGDRYRRSPIGLARGQPRTGRRQSRVELCEWASCDCCK
ncbi:hypothetical protein C7G43_10535 [Bradyrhizobium sp. MOS004]|nr:hypothetical protein C7G43_10535 [Bradyrhizobium sp. MOS004]HAR16186.1 hypothetical protein [Bradyrhizobium sp.]HAR26933.1 hypothetical protein [Bradyrhizobium sp.]